MTTEEENNIQEVVNDALDRAESIYGKVERYFRREVKFSNESIETDIPDFPFIEEDKPEVADFIALVLDVRGSTKHLLNACAACKVEMLERTLYESAALNSMGAFIINKWKGGVTEFLGDGFLALFRVKEPKDFYSAKYAADECILGLNIVNEILSERYKLPPIKVGIGLAYSQAIVMLIKANEKYYPKALGECVYRASKLSTGFDQILYDEHLKRMWPSSKGGKLKFVESIHKHKKDVSGYRVEKSKP